MPPSQSRPKEIGVLHGRIGRGASDAAAKQLANAAAFLDVERAVERVFGSSEGEGWFVF